MRPKQWVAANGVVCILAFFLVFPLVIVSYKQTGVPLSDIVCLLGGLLFFKHIRSIEAQVLFFSFVFAFGAAIYGVLVYDLSPVNSIASLAFLYKPCFAYFAARSLIDSQERLIMFSRFFVVFCFVLVVLIFLSVLFRYGGVFRADSHLNGDILGFEIFGAYGVNSLAAFYAILAFSVCAFEFARKKLDKFSLLSVVAVFLLFFMATSSLSRMAILSMLFLIFFIAIDIHKVSRVAFWAIAVLAGGVLVFSAPYLYELDFLSAKLNQLSVGFRSGDINYLSSGRMVLYITALEQIYNNPFFGAAFGGFEVYTTYIEGYKELAGLSPHNQYLVLLWKMGVPATVLYLCFLWLTVSGHGLRGVKAQFLVWKWRICFAMLVVFGLFWDALLIPNVAALFFFLMGCAKLRGQN